MALHKDNPNRNFKCCGEQLVDLRALVVHFTTRHIKVDPLQSAALASPDQGDFLGAEENVLQNVVDIVHCVINHDETNNNYDIQYLDRFLKHAAERRGILPSAIFLSGVVLEGQFKVGAGAFGDIYRGIYKGKSVALKALNVFKMNQKKKMEVEISKEAHLWRKLNHQNVLSFTGIVRDVVGIQIALVSPWVEKNSLSDILKEGTSIKHAKLVVGLARGLAYLHCLTPCIIHGDLKAENVMIDGAGEPRIIDFGLSRAVYSTGTQPSTFHGQGTLNWQAPELVKAAEFHEGSATVTTKSDVYAFSSVCLEIFTGKLPFYYTSKGNMLLMIRDGKHPRRPEENECSKRISDGLWSIMEHCWKAEPSDRPEMSSVVSQLEAIGF